MRALDRPADLVPDTYVSFASEEGFLGVVVVPEPDWATALAKIKGVGLDPGGQAACFSVPPGAYPRMRLLSADDLEGDADPLGELPEEKRLRDALNKLDQSSQVVIDAQKELWEAQKRLVEEFAVLAEEGERAS